jgi:hypothetical protein
VRRSLKPRRAPGDSALERGPLARLFEQFAERGGELLIRPICVKARQIDPSSFVPNASSRRDADARVARRRERGRVQLLTSRLAG